MYIMYIAIWIGTCIIALGILHFEQPRTKLLALLGPIIVLYAIGVMITNNMWEPDAN